MLSKFILLCLLAAVYCQKKIHNPGDTLVTPDDGAKDNQESCHTSKGQQGECVLYYLCDTALELPPEGVIDLDIREKNGTCNNYLDICCLASERTDKHVAVKRETQPKREGCGWRNPEGVGETQPTINKDTEAKFAEFPWICAILRISPVNNTETNNQEAAVYIGGGSLIHPSVVLTGAHLVASDDKWRVRAGEWDSQSIKEPYPHQDRQVASKVLHEDFSKKKLYYDIAVLFLSEPMDLAPNVALACLPPPRERVRAGTRCFATGWGKDKFGEEGTLSVILKKVDVPTLDQATCQAELRKTRLGQLFQLHTSFMCAGGELGKDTCTGDGGSPLSCPIEFEDGRYMQSGIVAWGIGCGDDGRPGVYVDVSNLRNWVDDKVAGKGYDPKIYSF